VKNNNIIIIILLSLIISSCSLKEPKEFTVKDLDKIEKRRIFLDSILAIDQKVRNDVMLAQQQFGNESKMHTLAGERCSDVDFSNLEVIHEYLKTFDYPSEEYHERGSNTTLCVAIRHALPRNDRGYRFKSMFFLLNAWETGNLKEKEFSFF
jgi:hypothetical protein